MQTPSSDKLFPELASGLPPIQTNANKGIVDGLITVINMPRKVFVGGRMYTRTISVAEPTDDYITIIMEADEMLREDPSVLAENVRRRPHTNNNDTPASKRRVIVPASPPREFKRKEPNVGQYMDPRTLTPYKRNVVEVISSGDEEEDSE